MDIIIFTIPMANTKQTQQPYSDHSATRSTILIIVVVLVLIAAGFYFLSMNKQDSSVATDTSSSVFSPNEPNLAQRQAAVNALNEQTVPLSPTERKQIVEAFFTQES